MRTVYFGLFLCILFSCKHTLENGIQTVEVNPELSESISLSEIASNVEIIILETVESSLIRGITNLEITNQYIFINDAGRRVLQFDLSGNFVRQIGKQGRGPDEYSFVYNIAADPNNEILYVSSQRKILCYDFTGELLFDIKQESSSEFVTVVNDQLWSISTRLGVESGNNYANITHLTMYDSHGNPSDTLLVKNVELSALQGTIFPQAWYISDLGKRQYLYYPVLLQEPVIRDTLYEVKNNRLIPSYKFDFGLKEASNSNRKELTIKNIYRTSNYLFVEYAFKGEQLFFCKVLNRKTRYNVLNGFDDDIHNTGTIQLRPLDLRNNVMYFIKDAYEVADRIDTLSDNSNPVIFIVDLL